MGGTVAVTLAEVVLGPGSPEPAPGPSTVRDAIQAAIAARNARTVRVVHPAAPEWTVDYRVPVDRVEVRRLLAASEAAEKAKRDATFDPALVAQMCVEVRFAGEGVLTGDNGQPLTWRDEAMWSLVGASGLVDCVRVAYGDGVVASIAKRLLDEAGYGSDDEVIVEDPQAG